MTVDMRGPLSGIRVVEFAGLGAAPFAAMLLSDLGAEVLRVDRPNAQVRPFDILSRGRASLIADLRNPLDVEKVREVVRTADVLLEGFRPGVMERLGFAPDVVCADNPRLIYARLTGWGQAGPLAKTAGHDINYIALAGVLGAVGPASGPPTVPLNLVGDFGGGALYAALGIASALFERSRSGKGQVIDAAMVDGAIGLMSMHLSHQQGGRPGSGTQRGDYFLDGSAPYYRCYECADGRFVAVGAIEPQFWTTLVEKLGVAGTLTQERGQWAQTSLKLEGIFRERSREDWVAIFDGTDACVTPVLTYDELGEHPHHVARQTFLTDDNVFQPRAFPRLSRTPPTPSGPPARAGQGGEELARRWQSSVRT